jgi:hypothetical protein
VGGIPSTHVADGIRGSLLLIVQSVSDDDPDTVGYLTEKVGHLRTRRQTISEPMPSTTMAAAAMPIPL